MRIAIGCDHAAYEMKQQVMKHLEEKGIDISLNISLS